MQQLNSYRTGPDESGRFGLYGGRFVAETLMPLILQVQQAYEDAKADPSFQAEIDYYAKHYVGRPSPLYFAKRMTEHLGGAKIYFKRDELNHTGSHKINNVMGQILLARRMGKTRIIAETGAGQHGVALNEAMRDWVANVEDTFYIIGTVAGPHPYPAMVRDFQSVIGNETKEQMMEAEGRLPDTLVACIGGGSNAMGLFHPFLDDKSVKIIGVEAAGKGIETGEHAASLTGGRPGVLHGNRMYLIQDEDGQVVEPYSISAGLDYPGIGPEHSWLKDTGRVTYASATDMDAVEAFQFCCKMEGIIPALEPSHALAHVMRIAPDLPKDHIIVMNLCGRGDKDVTTIANLLGVKL